MSFQPLIHETRGRDDRVRCPSLSHVSSPLSPATHPLEKGKDGRSQTAPGSLGSGAFMRVCSWESSQLPNLADRVRLLALVLDADVARLRKAPLL